MLCAYRRRSRHNLWSNQGSKPTIYHTWLEHANH